MDIGQITLNANNYSYRGPAKLDTGFNQGTVGISLPQNIFSQFKFSGKHLKELKSTLFDGSTISHESTTRTYPLYSSTSQTSCQVTIECFREYAIPPT